MKMWQKSLRISKHSDIYSHSKNGGADEILDQMRSLTGGGHANVLLRRTIEERSAL